MNTFQLQDGMNCGFFFFLDEDEVDERRPKASGFSAPMGMMGMSVSSLD